jgi:hypothetical protein
LLPCLQASSVPATQTLEELAGSVSPAASFQGRDEETFRCAGHCVGMMLSAYRLCCSNVGASISIAVHGDRSRQLQAHCLQTRPKISRDAHARPARPVQEMSRGDALRHELLLVCLTNNVAADACLAINTCFISRYSMASTAVLTNRADCPETCVHDA